MPAAIKDLYPSPSSSPPRNGITKLTNCRILRRETLVNEDIWISSSTGRILNGQKMFFDHGASPDRTLDLGGRVVSPGLIDVQLNGGFGFDFSVVPDDMAAYSKGLNKLNKNLVRTGVTSYCPTVISQQNHVYHKALPYLRQSGQDRQACEGAESLGAHCEGPFLNVEKKGIHKEEILRGPSNGFADIEECYGAAHLQVDRSPISYITIAPEQPRALECIDELRRRGIRVAIGHSEATFEDATAALGAGASMITHLFNAMQPLHHRNPGIFGVLGTGSPSTTAAAGRREAAEEQHTQTQQQHQQQGVVEKPFFGLIADGIHLHRTTVSLAWSSHPQGCILVTDAMSLAGLADGVYDWTNGERIRKAGALLTLEGAGGKIAGSSAGLAECVNNFLRWTGAGVAHALRTVTAAPARMLGLEGVKGTLEAGGDADLVVWDEDSVDGATELKVSQVWKFGQLVHDASAEAA